MNRRAFLLSCTAALVAPPIDIVPAGTEVIAFDPLAQLVVSEVRWTPAAVYRAGQVVFYDEAHWIVMNEWASAKTEWPG